MQQKIFKPNFIWSRLTERGKLIVIRFLIFLGVIMFLIVMVYVPYGINKSTDIQYNYNNKAKSYGGMKMVGLQRSRQLGKEFEDRSGCINNNCVFICVNSLNVSFDLEEILLYTNCSSIDNLKIENNGLINASLTSHDFLINHTILELSISDDSLIGIVNETFNKDIFTKTFTLTLETPHLTSLSSGMLLGLTKLEYLTINAAVEVISRVFLQPVRSSLKHLKLQHMTEKVKFEQIFGISMMTNLFHLDVSKNCFLEPIKKSTFLLLPMLQYLNMADCNINAIEENAFDSIWQSLKFLDLSQNQLTHIYDLSEAFALKPIYMHVTDNDWKCNCQLIPFVKVFKKYRDHFMDTPYCRHPQVYYGESIDAMQYECSEKNDNETEINARSTPAKISSPEMVEETTESQIGGAEEVKSSSEDSSSLESTSSTTTTTTEQNSQEISSSTEQPLIENALLLKCLLHGETNGILNIPLQKENMTALRQNSSDSYTFVEQPAYEFDISLLTHNSMLMTIEELDMDIDIIWFSDATHFSNPPDKVKPGEMSVATTTMPNKDDAQSFGCKQRVKKSVVIDNLKENTTYTVCLISNKDSEVSPFHCAPVHVPQYTYEPNYDHFNNDENAFTIAIICLVVTISTSLGGAISFFLIKSYPNLLKGSKKVVVVQKLKNEPMTGISPILTNSGILKQRFSKQNPMVSTPPTSPFVISCKDYDVDSAYETPVDSDQDYQISSHCRIGGSSTQPHINNNNCHSCNIIDIDQLPQFCIVRPRSPAPPLPKRNSEPIYGTIRSPMMTKAKRSI